ncbi:ATP-dependent zinc protease family protein [Hyphococcus luteus]|uniref:ATP-dependent zinc protease n=1 Tax=Hyphococcus luteus TaxID=2058213 RepID=A0A2S7K137_9PROT|nr:RimK/LysX family protein [Marinicaulis flavus]PQA86171.1 ATP-dependent zinc protease [Marinicaulis flavus]
MAETKAKTKTKKARKPKPRIGWREWADLPDFEVENINAKIDTGAKTSAIHAFHIREIMIDGVEHVEFYLHPVQRRKKPEIFCSAPIADRRVIRSSNGQEEERIVIQTRLRLGDRTWKIDLTLTNRDAMGFRLLLGRDALRRKFLIDPGASYLLSRQD